MTLRLLSFIIILTIPLFTFGQTEIDRGPYLQLATANSIVIQWRTEDPTQSIVWYGTSLNNLNQTEENTDVTEDHVIRISGLNAYTTYYYAVGDTTGILKGNSADFHFKTYPTTGSNTPFRAWVQGDSGTGTQDQRDTRDGFLSYLGNQDMDLMFMLGDNAYDDGKQSEYQDALFEDMYEDIMNKVVLWPSLGNHDSYSTDDDDRTGPYYDIFTLPSNGEAGGIPSGDESYYSYDYANVHFVALNSEDTDRSPDGPMAQWLNNDLANTSQDWIIAYFHHPIYSGAHNNESDDADHETDMRENILPILENHDVDLVLFGHTHNYQRSFLVKNHYGPSNTFDPLTMLVDGGSGSLEDETPYTKINDDGGAVFICLGNAAKKEDEPEEDLNHPTTFMGRDLLGSASLEVSGDQLDFKFILQDGSVEDHFTILKAINPLSISLNTPANNAHYPNLQNIPISASAEDPEGGVTKVEFFINGTLVKTDFSAPYNANWHPLHAGSYTIKATATDTDGFRKSDTRFITVGETTTACVQINQETDDAEQRENGSINITSGDLEMVEDDNNGTQVVGLRFNNLNIAKGAAISSAELNFIVKDDENENPCLLTIYGQTGTNTVTFATTDNNVSNRPKTNSNILWSPENWNEANATKTSANIGSIIQEIVLQDNYNASQSIVLIIEGIGSRNAIAFDQGDGSRAPELCITYDAVNCLDSDFDGTCDIDDVCPGSPEPGNACSDNNSGTFNDTVNNNCACIGIPYDCPDLQMQFGTPCNDNDVNTFDDRITLDCKCVGTPYDCPNLQIQFGTPCDDNNPFTCHDIITQNCECAGTPTSSSFTLNAQIDSDSDDAEQRSNGSVNITSGDLELITDNSDQIIGLRFDNPGILPGTVLGSAFIQFTVDENKNENPSNLSIFGERSISAATFTTNENNISTRLKTNASVTWSPDEWEDVGDSGPAQRTVNLAPILQEIINLPGYTINTPFVFIIEGEGKRVAVSHDKSSNNAPKLQVAYAISLDDTDGDGICDDEDLCFGPEPGSPCNDNNLGTYNDIVNANCQCIGTSYDCPDFGADIGSPCNDGNASTYNDYLNSNCMCVGSLFQCPSLNANIGDPCNDGDPLTTSDVVMPNCNCVGLPPVAEEICNQVSSNADDAEERSNGNCAINSTDLELVSDNGDLQLVGLRFRNINLQQGASVGESYIQFTVDNNNNLNPCNLTIHGELHPDAAVFEKSNNNISDRTLTNTSASWSPPIWEDNGDNGPAQQTVDIGPIIQEIVNQEDFTAESAIVLIISGQGLRQAISHDEDDNDAAELCVGIYASVAPLAMTNNDSGNTELQSELRFEEENSSMDLPFLKVFPNPTKASITASFNVSDEGSANINILDTNGKILVQQQKGVQKGTNHLSLVVSDLPNGVYFLTLQTNSERRIAKFSILK